MASLTAKQIWGGLCGVMAAIAACYAAFVVVNDNIQLIKSGQSALAELKVKVDKLEVAHSDLKGSVVLPDSAIVGWMGVYTGKWNDTWPISFTVIPVGPTKAIVFTQHLDHVDDQYQVVRSMTGEVVGRELKIADNIYLSRKPDGNFAAVGWWNATLRRAELIRQ